MRETMMNMQLLASKRLGLMILLMVTCFSLTPTALAQGTQSFAKITAQNAAQLKWQHGVSNGNLVNARWSTDKQSLFVVTNAGVYRYDSSNLSATPDLVSGSYVYTFDAYLSPDNQWVATSIDPGGKLRITNLVTGEFWTAFEELKSNWYKVQFSGNLVLALSYANRLWVYDVQQKRVVQIIDGVNDMALRPDGKQVAVSDPRGIGLWDVVTLKQVSRFIKRMPNASGLRFSADGKTLYSFASDTALYAFDVETRQQKYQMVASGFNAIEYAPQGNTAIMWGVSIDAPFVQTVNLETGKRVFSFRVTDIVREYTPPTFFAAISADGTRAATLSWNNKLRVWDVVTGKLLRDHVVRDSNTLAFSPDGKKLLINSVSEVLLYDYMTDRSETLAGYYGHNTADLRFSPNGQLLSTTGEDSVVRVWQVGDWDTLKQVRPSDNTTSVYQASYSPDSQTLLIGANDAGWLSPLKQLGKPVEAKTLTKLNKVACQATAYSSDGKLIACAENTSVVVWDAATKRVIWDYAKLLNKDNPTYFSSIAFTPDNKSLVIAPYLSRLDILDLATLKVKSYDVSLVQSIYMLAVSPDSKWIAAADGDNKVHLYDIRTGKEVWAIHGLGRSTRGFRSFIAFSPDGSLIASTDQGQKVRFFETTTGKVVAELSPNTAGEGDYDINGIAFSPDGTLLAGSTTIGVIGLWAVTP